MSLPDGTSISVKKLGQGSFATVYQGSDKWVYAFLRPDALDPAKELVMDLRDSSAGKKWRRHLPRFWFVGWAPAEGEISITGNTYTNKDWYDVYRSPYYYGLRAPEARRSELHNRPQIKRLRELLNETYSTFDDKTTRDKYTGRSFLLSFMDRIKLDRELESSIRNALLELCRLASRRTGDWRFEFPDRNLAVNEHGTLILLDVVFEADTLENSWYT